MPQPILSNNRIVVGTQFSLELFGRGRRFACPLADYRLSCFCGVTKLLGSDADSVELTIGRTGPHTFHVPTKPFPGSPDQSGERRAGPTSRTNTGRSSLPNEGRTLCRCVESVEKQQIAITIQHPGKLQRTRSPLVVQGLDQKCLTFPIRRILCLVSVEMAGEDIRIPNLAEASTEPLEVPSDMANP
jgi:hypothetical protein